MRKWCCYNLTLTNAITGKALDAIPFSREGEPRRTTAPPHHFCIQVDNLLGQTSHCPTSTVINVSPDVFAPLLTGM